MINSKVSKISTSDTKILIQSDTSTSGVTRSVLQGNLSTDKPVVGYYTYDSSNTMNNYIQLFFDGSNFYVKGQKGGADAVSKKLGEPGASDVTITDGSGKSGYMSNFNGTWYTINCTSSDIVFVASVSCNSNASPSNSILTDGTLKSLCNNTKIYSSGSGWNDGKGAAVFSFGYIKNATYVKINTYSYGTDGNAIVKYFIVS